MILIGTLVNTLVVLAGSATGLLLAWLAGRFSSVLPAGSIKLGERLQTIIMQGVALCVLFLGISGSLSGQNSLITILAIAAGTQLTRWLPFWLFPEKKAPPAVVLYLGKVLPPAMMGLLTVYCFKNVTWLSGAHGAPELLASAAVVGLHLWKRNVLFSIAGGTALYMVLVQAVFA